MSWMSAFYQGGEATILSGNVAVNAMETNANVKAKPQENRSISDGKSAKAGSRQSSVKVKASRRMGKVQ